MDESGALRLSEVHVYVSPGKCFKRVIIDNNKFKINEIIITLIIMPSENLIRNSN